MHLLSGYSQLDLFGKLRASGAKATDEADVSDRSSSWNYVFASVCLAITAVCLLCLVVLAARGVFL